MPGAPFKVKAIYDYKSAEPDDLNFPNGQIITVTAEEDDDWYAGEYVDGTGKKLEGIFPKNFVEKYEPEIPLRPSRPTRAKKDADPIPAAVPASVETQVPEVGQEPALKVREAEIAPQLSPKETPHEAVEPPAPTQATQGSVQRSAPSAATKSPVQSPKPAAHKPPPPVAEKPDVGSFKDRMAMFNKPAAPPIAPFKPGGIGSGASGFIKKPFVPPPPSKNAYVPPPREPPPQHVYRREEDPSLATEHTNEAAATVPPAVEPEAAGAEDQPKPTSLKDRIALLQKQQLEQARRAEGALKKEKPKKPVKKHTEVEDSAEPSDVPSRPSMDRIGAGDTVGKKSVDFADDESGPLRGHASRQASGHPALPTPPQPSRELVSDTNDADDDTEEAPDTSAEEERSVARHAPAGTHHTAHSRQEVQSLPPEHEADAEEGDDGADEEEAEEEEVDPEVRRRMEIRERMAKMSGGMGMMGIFGPAGGLPSAGTSRKPKPLSEESGRHVSSGQGHEEAAARAPPVPVMALPGMSRTRSPEAEGDIESDTEEPPSRATPKGAIAPVMSQEDNEAPAPPKRSSTGRSAPPIPQERPVPPPPPRDARAAPVPYSRDQPAPDAPASPSEPRPGAPPPPRMERPLGPGEDSDDEELLPASHMSLNDGARPQSKEGLPLMGTAPPLPPGRPDHLSLDTASPTSPTMNDKRISRGPPPIPMASPTVTSPQTRAPPPLPPPPPGQPPSRRSTSDSRNIAATKHQIDDDSEEEVTEYDGDYDTDIASSAKHKDALKSHGRDSSLDEESILTDGSQGKPPSTDAPGRTAPPLPQASAPRDVPPWPPQNASKSSRQSAEMPRAAPPPVPPPKQPLDEEYDPFRYSSSQGKAASQTTTLRSPSEEVEEGDLYEATPVNTRAVPPPPPAEWGIIGTQPSAASPQPSLAAPQQPVDINRSKSQARRSMEQSRPSGEHGFIAADVDVAQSSYWWAQENVPPPSLQNRQDVLYEIESSTSTKRGGKAMVSKDVYVLYMDYSQSTVTANFDAIEASNVTFEQRHERPPPAPRQDQLESASAQYGAHIAEAAHSRQNVTVGDGSPHALVLDLIQPLAATGVLAPVGTRAYGALVYANLANASTQQFDEIRPGDVVTFRNAKFAGHKGTIHAKYATEAGRPGQDHVGIALDWDGTKKKIRVWEQGRDEAKGGKKGGSGKVHEESYKVGDLKSGEVRVYRVMGRSWVGWDK